MAEATAVAEPEVQTEPQAAPETESQAPVETEGTDGSQAVQTETAPEAPAEGSPPADTEGERLRAEAREAELEAAREEAREEERQRLTSERQTERQKRNLQAFHEGFSRTAQDVRQTLGRLTIVDSAGNQRPLTQQEIQSLVLSKFEAHNGFVLGTREEDMNSPVAEAVEALLSKDAYKAFSEKAHGKPAKDFLSEFAEAHAMNTKSVSGMTLDQAMDASKRVKADVLKERTAFVDLKEKYDKLVEKYGPEGDPLKGTSSRGSAQRSDEELMLDPSTPIEEVRKILARING